MLKGILFDFDGTLADTMQHNFECWKVAVREHGREINAEEFFPLEGMKSQEIARNLLKECFKNEAQLDAVLKRKDGLFKESYVFKPYPGVFEFLKLTKDLGVKHAIVTAARQERLVTACPKEFLNGFDFVVTNETSGRGKPFPDPYESGLKGLGLKAADCLVIENAPLGVKAAKAAGLKCIAITSTLPAKLLAEADQVIEKFEQLFELSMFKNQLNRHSAPGAK